MKKGTKRILSISADVALKTALAASGLASVGGLHQPKEPENLKKVAEKRNGKA